jgi:hypothetical protein
MKSSTALWRKPQGRFVFCATSGAAGGRHGRGLGHAARKHGVVRLDGCLVHSRAARGRGGVVHLAGQLSAQVGRGADEPAAGVLVFGAVAIEKVVGRTSGGVHLVRAHAQQRHRLLEHNVASLLLQLARQGIDLGREFLRHGQRTRHQPRARVAVGLVALHAEVLGRPRGGAQLVGAATQQAQRSGGAVVARGRGAGGGAGFGHGRLRQRGGGGGRGHILPAFLLAQGGVNARAHPRSGRGDAAGLTSEPV